MNVFLGDRVTLVNADDTWVTGRVNGIKLDKGQLEKVSIEGLDLWFYMGDGWKFAEEFDDEELEEDD